MSSDHRWLYPILVAGIGYAAACVGHLHEQPAGAATADDPVTGTHSSDGAGAEGGSMPAEPGGTPAPSAVGAVPPDPTVAARCDRNLPRGTRAGGLVKLTKGELLGTLKSLFGARKGFTEPLLLSRDYRSVAFEKRDAIQAGFNEYPGEYSLVPGEDFEGLFSREQLSAWLSIVDAVATRFVDRGWAQFYWSTACSAEPLTEACKVELVRRLGREVFRRPLEESELLAMSSEATGARDQAQHAIVSRLLLSPHFLYRMELGVGTDEPRVRLTSYEVATRLSYALTGLPPDVELSAAADAGGLGTLGELREHAERLLSTSAAHETLAPFFLQWILPNGARNPPSSWGNFAMLQDPSGIPNLYNANKLAAELETEAQDFIRYMVFEKKGTVAELLSERVAFPRTERAARIYAATAFSEDGRGQEAPGHPGLLTRAAFLASGGESPSPILRGVAIKKRVLCQPIPSPDFSIVASREAAIDAIDSLRTPNHVLVDQATGAEPCSSCHSYINPLGYLLEQYNPLGMRDTAQRTILQTYKFRQEGEPVPTTLPGVGFAQFEEFELPPPQHVIVDGADTTLRDADSFIAALSESASVRGCLSVRLFRATHRRSEEAGDACALADGNAAMENGTVLDAIASIVVNEDIFWRRP